MSDLPNIVLVHGAWADGSCWSTVIERLQARGYNVTAPQLQFVLDHLGNPRVVADATTVDEAWLAATEVLAAAPNVAFKLSGLLARIYISGATVDDLKPYVRALADVVGPEPVAFGSDWPVCTAVSDYAGTVGIAQRLAESFGPDAQEQIFRRSAMAAYRLGWQ